MLSHKPDSRRMTLFIGLFCATLLTTTNLSGLAAADTPEVRCSTDVRMMSQRDVLHLEDAADMTDVRFGIPVSSRDAARLDRLVNIRDSIEFDTLRASYVDLLGDQLVSVTWSYVTGVEVRVFPGTDTSGVETLADKNNMVGSVSVVPIPDAIFSETERSNLLVAMQNPTVLNLFDQAQVVSIDADEACGTITLLVKSKGDVAYAREILAPILDVERVEIRLATEFEVDHDTAGRDDPQTTQAGGLEYRVGTKACTSAAPWYRTFSSPYGYYQVKYAVTAAHCIAQSAWSATPSEWGGLWWWTATAETDLKQPLATIADLQVRLRYGAELDVALWPLKAGYSAGLPRSAINTDTYSYVWHNLGWWQWSPTWETSESGGDAWGDQVCQSGITTSYKTPDPIWISNIVECGSLFNRARSYSVGTPEASWFYNMRESSTNVCDGDSGGTVWRDAWYTGIAKSGRNSAPSVDGNPCYADMTYSHIGYMPSALGLTAPIGFS